MSTKIKIRRDTLDNWQQYNPVLGDGELALIKDTGELKIGNGLSRVNELPSINNNFNGYAYELVKEFNNVIQMNLVEISCIDTDELIIEFWAQSPMTTSSLLVYFNDDNDYNNYQYMQGRFNEGNPANAGTSKSLMPIHQTNFSNQIKSTVYIYPQNKHMRCRIYNYDTGSNIWAQYFRDNYWLNNTDSVSSIKFIAHDDVPCICRIYKRVQIVAQAPYKKLVASASNVNQLNGINLNIDINKKYEIEMICNQQTSQNIYYLIDNDNGSNYIRRYKGVWDANSFNSGQQNLGYISIKWSNETNQTHKGILYPFSKTYNCYYSRINNSGQGYFENWNDTYLYQGGDIQTLNFYAPNDDIPCKFKVWEITE